MIPLVMLPGMMCDARLFGPQIARFSGQRPVMTNPLAKGQTITDLAAHVLAHAPPRFALMGLSLGGIVAMEVVAQAPDRVERLALLDTNPRAEKAAVKARRGPQIAAVERGELARIMREEMKPGYLAEGALQADILDLCLAMALDLGPAPFVRQSLALRDRPDQTATLRAYDRPALVLCGRQDRLCPVATHEEMARLMPHAHLVVIEEAGHLPVLEQPEPTNAALADWLEDG